jgi:beta-lactamase regulating signal transducer with metallopeptidase domain
MNVVAVESTVRVLDWLSAWAWRASWEGAALAGIVAIILWMFGRKVSPAWRFALWGLVLIRLAMPAVVGVNWKWLSATNSTQPDAPISFHASQRPPVIVYTVDLIDGNSGTPFIMKAPVAPAPKATAQIRGDRWLMARRIAASIWLVGIALLGSRVAWSSMRLARAVSRMKPVDDPRVLAALRSCCAQMKIARPPQARELACAGAPALVGFWRPNVLLPLHVLEEMGERELRLILLHELAHVKRRDVLVNWLATLVAVVHWLNPAVWLVMWRMRVERELACDELVLRVNGDRGATDYARTIVKLVEALTGNNNRSPGCTSGVTGAVGIIEGKTQIQRRLLMITRFEASGRRWPALAAVVALVVGALALSGATRAAEKSKGASSAPPAGAPAGAGATPAGSRNSVDVTSGGLPGAAGPGAGSPAGAANPFGPLGGGPTAGAAGDAAAPRPPVADYRLAGPISPEEEKANARTAEKLKRPIDKINFNGQALSDVIDFLRDAAGVDVLVEWAALEQIGVARDAPVTLVLREPAPLDAILPLMFRSMGLPLHYEIDKGVVVIGSAADGRASTVMRVYDVSDLVANLEGGKTAATDAGGEGGGGGGGGVGSFVGRPGAPAVGGPGSVNPATGGTLVGGAGGGAMEQLVSLILSTIHPDVWMQAGGQASIGVFKTKLVIKAPEGVHKEVASLLEMLREKPAGATRTTAPNTTREARP